MDEHITLPQLSVDLSTDGCGGLEARDVVLNPQTINEFFVLHTVPLTFVDGWVGRIRADVPLLTLLTQPSKVSVEDVEVTVRGMNIEQMKAEDVLKVSSIIRSQCRTFDREDVARNVLEAVLGMTRLWDEISETGAALITRAVSGFSLTARNVTIRLESQSSSKVATAIEMKLEEMTFLEDSVNFHGVTLCTDVFSTTDDPKMRSDPIKFAEVLGDIRVTLNGKALEVSIDAVNVFAVPSQTSILKRVLSSITTLDEAALMDREDELSRTNDSFHEFGESSFATKSCKSVRFDRPDETSLFGDVPKFNLCVGTVLIVIPHTDYLGTRYVDLHGSYEAGVRTLKDRSREFFAEKDRMYPEDHLRFVAKGLEVSSCQLIGQDLKVQEILERSDGTGRFETSLLEFQDCQDPHLEVNIQKSLNIVLGRLKSELDVSIVDRISDLLVLRPFFQRSDDPMRNAHAVGVVPIVHIGCPSWQVVVRVPKVHEQIPTSQRNLYEEFLRFGLKNIDIMVPEGRSEVTVLIDQLSADFCAKRFLLASRTGSEKIEMKIHLQKDIGPLDETPSNEPFSEFRRAGPFSTVPKIQVGEENREMIEAGTRGEMLKFHEGSEDRAAIRVSCTVPLLNVHVPDKVRLELLYNRIVNELLLFRPLVPVAQRISGAETDNIGSHNFVIGVNVLKSRVLCATMTKEEPAEPTQVAFNLRHLHFGATFGFQGDEHRTFYHVTTSELSIGHAQASDKIPNAINRLDFATWSPELSQMSSEDPSDGDVLGIAVDLTSKSSKSAIIAIALRNCQIVVDPLGTDWPLQLADLFDLGDSNDHPVPSPSAHVHFSTENVAVNYDHTGTRFRTVFKNGHVETTIQKDQDVLKANWLLENCALFMGTSEVLEVRAVLLYTSMDLEADEKKRCLEVRGENGVVKTSMCSKLLADYVNIVKDCLNCWDPPESTQEVRRFSSDYEEDEMLKILLDAVKDVESDRRAEDSLFSVLDPECRTATTPRVPSSSVKSSQKELRHRFQMENFTIQVKMCARHGEDHVNVELRNVSALAESFADRSTASSLQIGDVVVRDRIEASKIAEMLYRYTSSRTPVLSVHASGTADKVATLRVSMQPIKINLDQDTMEFFFKFCEEAGVDKDWEDLKGRDGQEDVWLDHDGLLIDLNEENVETENPKLNKGPSELFFEHFLFSPPAKIYLDYHGKQKLGTHKAGVFVGFLMAFGQLDRLPITLKAIDTRKGLLGVHSVLEHAVDTWTHDILKRTPVVGSFTPIVPILNVGNGFVDLVREPMAEYRTNGSVARGVRRGLTSFGFSSTTGVVEAAQTIAGIANTLVRHGEQNIPAMSSIGTVTQASVRLLDEIRTRLLPETCEDELRKWGGAKKKK
ncbi:unnamed protein product [Caenorhabditis sp. 36 PRJEB53466]|nr:unnamed protein product [Caenorhabditis sp. 36 PRJEB53466]